jgi:uncharacterized protein with PIN domain
MKLLLDAMLGKLARYLRMCGHDAAYVLDRGIEADDAILALAAEEDRRIMTRDVGLASRAGDAVLIESREVDEQLAELRGVGFQLALTEPVHCGRCNGRLEPVSAEDATPEYAPDPGERPVWRCPECGQHFWRGSHWEDVRARLDGLEE